MIAFRRRFRLERCLFASLQGVGGSQFLAQGIGLNKDLGSWLGNGKRR